MVAKRVPDVIDGDYTMVQAADVLRRATDVAERQNDPKSMMDIVAGWLELHSRFSHEETQAKKGPIGFVAPSSTVEAPEIDGELDDE